MINETDESLVEQYLASKESKFLAELFHRHYDVMYRTALRIMANPVHAEDILQTVYCKIIQDLSSYKKLGSALGWMLKIVIHTCYNTLNAERSRTKRERKVMSQHTESYEPSNNDIIEVVEKHLEELPEIYKIPIIMHIKDGLTPKEVSIAIGKSEKTIRSQIARGLEKLRNSLQTVGVSLSVTMLITEMKKIPLEPIPHFELNEENIRKFIQQPMRNEPTKILHNIRLFKVVFATLLVVIGGTFYFMNQKPILTVSLEKQNTIARQYKKASYRFEKTEDLNIFGVAAGEIKVVKEKGVENSNAIEAEKNSILSIDISKFQLPIKISFYMDSIVETDKEKGNSLFKADYEEDKNIVQIIFTRPLKTITKNNTNQNKKEGYLGTWREKTYFISEDYIMREEDNKIFFFLYGKSKTNSKILIHNFEKNLYDSCVIEEVPQTSSKDVSVITQYIENIPYSNHIYQSDIPDPKILGLLETQLKIKLSILKPQDFTLNKASKNIEFH